MLEYSKDNRYTTLINVATPGMGLSYPPCVNEKDTKHLIEMRKHYKNVLRNLWDPLIEIERELLVVTQQSPLYYSIGDVLPCPYVHIKVGNILTESLKYFKSRVSCQEV